MDVNGIDSNPSCKKDEGRAILKSSLSNSSHRSPWPHDDVINLSYISTTTALAFTLPPLLMCTSACCLSDWVGCRLPVPRLGSIQLYTGVTPSGGVRGVPCNDKRPRPRLQGGRGQGELEGLYTTLYWHLGHLRTTHQHDVEVAQHDHNHYTSPTHRRATP